MLSCSACESKSVGFSVAVRQQFFQVGHVKTRNNYYCFDTNKHLHTNFESTVSVNSMILGSNILAF